LSVLSWDRLKSQVRTPQNAPARARVPRMARGSHRRLGRGGSGISVSAVGWGPAIGDRVSVAVVVIVGE
jgi:hypothetical protein